LQVLSSTWDVAECLIVEKSWTRAASTLAWTWPNSLHGVTPDVASDLNAGVDLPTACANVVMSISVLEHLHRPATMLSESWRIP
jgi:hypothetical protein